MRQDRDGLSLTRCVLPSGQTFLTGGMLPHASDRGVGARPREMGLADVGPRRAGACAGRCLGTRPETTIRSARWHPREALAVREVVAPHAAEHRAHAGDGAQQRGGMGVMVLGSSDEGALEVAEPRIGAAVAGEIDGKVCWPRGIGHPFRDAVALGLVGDLCAARRQVLWAVGLLHGRQECAACAC